MHGAWLRLVGEGDQKQWDSRSRFFAAAAEAMRRIMIGEDATRERLEHGGGRERVDLDAAHFLEEGPAEDLEALDQALTGSQQKT